MQDIEDVIRDLWWEAWTRWHCGSDQEGKFSAARLGASSSIPSHKNQTRQPPRVMISNGVCCNTSRRRSLPSLKLSTLVAIPLVRRLNNCIHVTTHLHWSGELLPGLSWNSAVRGRRNPKTRHFSASHSGVLNGSSRYPELSLATTAAPGRSHFSRLTPLRFRPGRVTSKIDHQVLMVCKGTWCYLAYVDYADPNSGMQLERPTIKTG